MTSSLTWRLVLGFALVFIAGVATGNFISVACSHRGWLGAHDHLAKQIQTRMTKELGLTQEQIEKGGPIFVKEANELEQVRRDTHRRVHDIIAEAHHELAPLLTAEQRAKLEAMEASHRRKAISENASNP
jgi:Spy/CpxP family protein refolding chaperone